MVVRALYLADEEDAAWAEWYRHTSELGVPPQRRLPRETWRYEVDLPDIANLTAPGALAAFGIPALRPTRRDWPATQPIGEALWRAGRRGLLAPSAARTDGRVLAVFREAPGAIAGIRPSRRPKRYTELPALPTGMRT